MQYVKLGGSGIQVPSMILGTWAFGGGPWWGKQEDRDSVAVLEAAFSAGIYAVDTAPVYGRGRSESIVGAFVDKRKIRDKTIIATKVGLSWKGSKIIHDLSKNRLLQELDESRKRLRTDYFDLYQVHWPDPDTPIAETAEVMRSLFEKKIIKAVGVSNYSVEQMQEFMRYCPLHSLQPEFSMFNRTIEAEIVPFCIAHNIAILSYAPLYSGLLTGKFFLDGQPIPGDINRKLKAREFQEPRYSINREALVQLKAIASGYKKTLTQLVLNWNFSQRGITAAVVGSRTLRQLQENLGSLGWKIQHADAKQIEMILKERDLKIYSLAGIRHT